MRRGKRRVRLTALSKKMGKLSLMIWVLGVRKGETRRDTNTDDVGE